MGAEPKYHDAHSRGKCHQWGGNFFALRRVNGDCAGRESRARCFRVATLGPMITVVCRGDRGYVEAWSHGSAVGRCTCLHLLSLGLWGPEAEFFTRDVGYDAVCQHLSRR